MDRIIIFTLCFGIFCCLPLAAVEQVEYERGQTKGSVSGEIVVEAADGGLLLQDADGVLWAFQPEELKARKNDGQPFALRGGEELSRQLLEEFPDGFRIHKTAHYVICYNTSTAYAQWCGALYERLYKAFENYWSRRGCELHEPAAPLVALVFDRPETYARYARQELGEAVDSIIGYYSLRTNRVTMYDLTGVEEAVGEDNSGAMKRISQILSQPDAARTVATIVHEATHQLAFNCGLHQRYADIPLWVSEGIAVYFETPDLDSSRGWRTVGALNRVRLLQFRKYLADRPADSLQTLLQDDARFRDTSLAADAYAEAWALNYFLIRRYPRQHSLYLNALAEKKPLLYDSPEERVKLFETHFGKTLPKLDEEFTRTLRALR